METKIQIAAFIRAVSILMFFVTFFTNYIIYQAELIEAFFKGMISLVVANLILHVLLFVWKNTFSEKDWKIIIDGKPESENYSNSSMNDTDMPLSETEEGTVAV